MPKSMSNSTSEKNIMRTISIVSVLIPVAVAVLMIMPASWKEALGIAEGSQLSSLPLFHAVLNGSTFVLLVFAGIAIKNKKVSIHRTFMLSAFVLSSVFLISYVIYHVTHDSAEFGGEGAIRALYFFILISHIILSVPVIPLALLSIYRGWTNNIVLHKKIVKYAYPIWLYVALTGVLVYLFMKDYY
jgi:putative membrane protein